MHLIVCFLTLGLLLATPTFAADGEPRTAPVDTVELALTQRGQSAATVRQRLGVPAQVIPLPILYRVTGATAIPVEREVWVYRGNSQVGDAVITFVNGVVESVERKR
jgi:hypothetical protein